MQGANSGTDLPAGGALRGIRIIDFSQYLAGPLASMLLADFGAEVFRVDPPGGPRWRHPANACLHRGKQALVLDLKSEEGLREAKHLIAAADVVIEGFRPGVMARLGLTHAELRQSNPGLVWCSLPGFAHDDARAGLPAWEGVICAAAALYPQSQHETTGGPLFSAIPYASNFAGFLAAHSIVAALLQRNRTGCGDAIEVALFDAAAEAIAMGFEVPRSVSIERMLSVLDQAGIANRAEGRLYRCRDGRFVRRDIPLRGLHAFWDRYMPAGLKDDPSEEAGRQAEALLEDLFLTRDAEEWERIGQSELRAAFAVHLSSAEWMRDDHARDSHTVLTIDDPEFGRIAIPGFGLKVAGKPDRPPAPRQLSPRGSERSGAALSMPRRPDFADVADGWAGGQGRPLEGIRMLDFSNLLAGPTAGRIMAQYGAEVIKVSRPSLAKGKPNPTSDEPFAFVGHRTTGLGKKSMFLELSAPEAAEIVAKLVASADIVHHNFSLGVAERYRLGQGSLQEVRPDLIYSTVRVHGAGGWRETFRGHEQIAQSTTGMTVRFGSPDAPVELEVLNNDYATAHLSVLGILIGLFARDTAGCLQTVEAALSRTATLCQIPYMVDERLGPVVEPSGSDALGWGPWNRLYRCRDGWIFVAAVSETSRKKLAEIIGEPRLAVAADADVAAAAEAFMREQPKEDVSTLLQSASIAAHPYVELAELLADETRLSRGLMVRQSHRDLVTGLSIGRTARFASRPNALPAAAVRPGSDTRSLLDALGFGSEEFDDLVHAGVLAEAVPHGTPFSPD